MIAREKIDIFIPPWNGYDSNTIFALEKTDFKILSAGIKGFSINSQIKYLPITTNVNEIKKLFHKNLNIRLKNITIVVNFHSFEFDNIENVEMLKKLLKDLKCSRKIKFLGYSDKILLNSQSLNLNKNFQYVLSLMTTFWASFSGYHSFYLITENDLDFYETLRLFLTFLNFTSLLFFLFLCYCFITFSIK